MSTDPTIRGTETGQPAGTLRSRPFVALWGGTAASNLADGVLAAAAPLLAAALTRDPVVVSGVFVAQKLPWFLLTLVSGVLVDRVSHRLLLVTANALRCASLAALAVSLATQTARLPLLFVVMFLLGTAETVIDTAALAVLPRLVDRSALEDANGRIYSTQSILNELVGPPLGSALVAVSAVAAFASGSAFFAGAALLLLLLPRTVTPPVEDEEASRSLSGAILAGLRYFWSDRLLRAAAVMAGVSNLFSSAMAAVLVLYARDRLQLSAAAYGLFLSAEALGGILAGLAAGRMVRRLGPGPVVFASNLLPAAAYALLALTTSPWIAGIGLALQAAASTLGNVVLITLRQTAVPAALVGRVTSAYRLVALGAVPLGGLLGGLLVSGLGIVAPFVVGAVALAALALVMAPIMTTRALTAASAPRPEQ
jgi:MFS family permease